MQHVRLHRLSRHSPEGPRRGGSGTANIGACRHRESPGHPAQRPGTGCCWPSRASGFGGAERLVADLVAASDSPRLRLRGRLRPRRPRTRSAPTIAVRRHAGPLARGRRQSGPPVVGWLSAACLVDGSLRHRPLPSALHGGAGPAGGGHPAPPSPAGDRLHRAQPVEQGGRAGQGPQPGHRPLRPGPGGRVPGRLRRTPPRPASTRPGGRPRRRPVPVAVDWSPAAARSGRRCAASSASRPTTCWWSPWPTSGRRRATTCCSTRPDCWSARGTAGPVRGRRSGGRGRRAGGPAPPVGAGRAVPVPRPSERRPRAHARRRHRRARLPPGGPAGRADGGDQRGCPDRGHRGRGRAPGGRRRRERPGRAPGRPGPAGRRHRAA